jgi:hypothetical protein
MAEQLCARTAGQSTAQKAAARSFDALCNALSEICTLFDPQQCRNFFKAAGYEAHQVRHALGNR